MNNFRKKVGKRTRFISRIKDISRESIGADIGNNSKGYISKAENGRINFSMDTLGKILEALKTTSKESFDFE